MCSFAEAVRIVDSPGKEVGSRLPVNVIVLASGIGSVRRFNDLFLERYELNPPRFSKTTNALPAESMTFTLGADLPDRPTDVR